MNKPIMNALLRVQLTNDLATEVQALTGAGPLERVRVTGRIVALLKRLEGLDITPEQAAFDKAKAFYQGTLQGQVVASVVGPVRLTGKGWRKAKFGLKEDLLKARLIERIVEILQGGTAGERREAYKQRDDGMVAFYFIQKDVQIDQEVVTAGVTVGEDAQGNLFYNVSHAGAKGWTPNENGTLDSTWIEPRFILDAVNDSLAEDDLNITILAVRPVGAPVEDEPALFHAAELYHGTALPFETFAEGVRRGAGYDHQGAGWYLTNDRQGLARFFASMAAVKLSGRPGFTPEEEQLLEEDGVILRVSIAGAKVLDLTRPDADPELLAIVSDIVNGKALRERVMALGLDGVAFVEPNPPEGVVVLSGAVTVVMYHPEKAQVMGYEAAGQVPALPFPSDDPKPETSSGRAKPGGEVGVNGFFYKGGTFLPSTQLPPQGSQGRTTRVRTLLVEPGVRAEAPEGYEAIFGSYQQFIQVGADGVASVQERPDEAIAAYVNNDVAEGRAFLLAAVDAYNGGMRWYKAGDIRVTQEHREEPAAPEYEIIEHETGRGKILRGIVRTDLTYAEAKAIDEYTFKKNGGYFIREKHLEGMGVVPAGGGEPAPVPAVDPEAEALRQQQREIERQQREADRLANEQERERRRLTEQVAGLRKVAASSLEKANEELNRDRLTNTHRRAGMAAGILERAEKDRALSVTLNNLADAIEQGKATHLAGLTSKAQLATLHDALVGGRHRAQTGLSYQQQQELKHAPLSGKDAGYAQLPRLFMNHDYEAVQRALETGKPKGWQALSRQLKLQNRDNIDLDLYAAVWKALESVGKTDAFNWYGREQLAKRQRMVRMGLKTDDDLRVALGEYLQFKEGVREEDPIAKAERAIIGQKVGIDFFPTPKGEATNMARLAHIGKGDRVLEPSAGNGNLADAARAAGGEVDVIEISDSLRKILEAKGYNVVAWDFMSFTPEQPYDAILMNPPWSSRKDAEHVMHAFQMLRSGGRLVALVGEGVFIGSDQKAIHFRDWLERHGAKVEVLDKGTFMDKKLLATTGANGRRVTITA